MVENLTGEEFTTLNGIIGRLSYPKRDEVLEVLLQGWEISIPEDPMPTGDYTNGDVYTNLMAVETKTIDWRETMKEINKLPKTYKTELIWLLQKDKEERKKREERIKKIIDLENRVSINNAEMFWVNWKEIIIPLPSGNFSIFISNKGVSDEYISQHKELENCLYSQDELSEFFEELGDYLIWTEIKDIPYDIKWNMLWYYLQQISKFKISGVYKTKDIEIVDGEVWRGDVLLDHDCCWIRWFGKDDPQKPCKIIAKKRS